MTNRKLLLSLSLASNSRLFGVRLSSTAPSLTFSTFALNAQQQELQSGRQDQRKGQAPVAADLPHFLSDQRTDAIIEDRHQG